MSSDANISDEHDHSPPLSTSSAHSHNDHPQQQSETSKSETLVTTPKSEKRHKDSGSKKKRRSKGSSKSKKDHKEAKDVSNVESKDEVKDEVVDSKDEVAGSKVESKDEVAESKDEVAESKDEVAESKDEVAESKVEVAESKDEVAESKDEVAESKDEVAKSKDEVAESKDEVAESKDDVALPKDEVDQSKDVTESKAETSPPKDETTKGQAAPSTQQATQQPHPPSVQVPETVVGTGASTPSSRAIDSARQTTLKPKLSRTDLGKEKHADTPVAGKLVDEKHANYVLMHDMLCGIRTVLSRLHAKRTRPLKDDDYTASHKLAFDITGNELTPSSKYDFKFKDYAPWVFRSLRDHFQIDPADYIVSLTGRYVLSELGSPGKSGSFFYFSRDYRFIIKTISHTEHKFFRQILRQYYEYTIQQPNTLLARFYGLYRVKMFRILGGQKLHFVVMQNIFPPNRDIHETYDLKGSLIGRYVEPKPDKNSILKDINFQQSEQKLVLGPEKRQLFLEQIQNDSAFLAKMRIMDYSLLLGIHDLTRGNSEKVLQHQLTVVEPKNSAKGTETISKKQRKVLKKEIKHAEAKPLDSTANPLPAQFPKERAQCVFYHDEGGFQSTDETNNPRPIIYHMGIIDILTPYNRTKQMEHFFKSLNNDRNLISAVEPTLYAERFTRFLVDGVSPLKKSKTKRSKASEPESDSAAPSGLVYQSRPSLEASASAAAEN